MKREDFKLLEKVVYLDSAAGALKPKQVVDAMLEFYNEYPINPHSVDSALGVKVMQKVNGAREKVAELIGASANEIIFTSGTTDSLNKIANMFKKFLKKDDEILLSYYNHSSNIIPWIEIAKQTGAKIIYKKNLFDGINSRTKIVAYAQSNNTLYQYIDKEKLYKDIKKVGAVLVNDAAQAVVHEEVSLHDSDVVIFSGNKIYGPTGTGVLAVRKELLSFLEPSTYGGGANTTVSGMEWNPKEGVMAHEAGTINTAGIIGLGAAIDYFTENFDSEKEIEISEYLYDELSKLENVNLISRRGEINTLFNVDNVNSQDVVSYLGHKGIILRSGSHCAKVLNEIIGFKSSIRVSLAGYNNKEDINSLVKELSNGGDFLDFI